ncbi:AI-2E family transporter [Providencia alcalifaciens]|uniref:AI-2E family transporter n=1 Tax=Providencia alcalifaciens TaxID=126385 RepID=A0AAW9VB91_9GAMM|nr:AI-2E family transporter [Providencia alcalifaciens]ETT05591.1 PF01594 domain protein [Providencia alcalifaciens F90-2004]EUC94837.1 PF01594 domain protein [Providencia alcalifaciens PAL-2]EUD07707.1 PF01594 domain protein [Providencia alcalifaciens R90-1475]MTB33410.1 AI-2E family transporter [Providencia alcalifaciens]MTC35000.1 AI-2E family transporter [Providencia alcalifaciens]
MLEMFLQWYRRRFADPQAVALFSLLVIGFLVIFFFSSILAPLLVAIVLAYLLEWPTHLLQRLGLSRVLAVSIILTLFAGISAMVILIIAPTAWQQGINLVADLPNMVNRFSEFARRLPEQYPALVDAGIIDMMADNVRSRLSVVADSVVKASVASLIGIFTLAVYLVLVPLMMFFLLKDKEKITKSFLKLLPKNRLLVSKVWLEMNQQITNYLRGKVTEMVIVGVFTYIGFAYFDLRYSVLLSVLVGVSVLIPYIGAVVATIPVVLVALFQWGIGTEFWSLFIVYLVIQGLDSNIVVPLLYSEAVNLHPLIIILSVVIFGGLWGFWGVFFAIPLATLIKAVINAWPQDLNDAEMQDKREEQ